MHPAVSWLMLRSGVLHPRLPILSRSLTWYPQRMLPTLEVRTLFGMKSVLAPHFGKPRKFLDVICFVATVHGAPRFPKLCSHHGSRESWCMTWVKLPKILLRPHSRACAFRSPFPAHTVDLHGAFPPVPAASHKGKEAPKSGFRRSFGLLQVML